MKTIAFIPNKKTATERSDGCSEASINWEDDSGAASNLFERAEQSAHGIAKLATDALARTARIRSVGGRLRWERDPTRKNLYHGNILFGPGSKPNEKEIAATLALASSWIPPREPSGSA